MASHLRDRYPYNPAMPRPPAEVDSADGGTAGRAVLRQSADAVLMVRPAAFGWNPETCASNTFQQQGTGPPGLERARALTEFDALVEALGTAGPRVFALDEPGPSACPDAVFPNNWVSLHHDGTVVLYPMNSPRRRLERRTELIARLDELGGYAVTRLLDLTHHELSGRFLEGTGSVVFDHAAKVAYACRSPRTDVSVLGELCEELDYEPIAFDAASTTGVPIYHTNVMLSIGSCSAIVCEEAVAESQRGLLLERLLAGGRKVVTIDQTQMAAFAGNVLELRTAGGGSVLALSSSAWHAFGAAAREVIGDCVDAVIASPVPTIEQLGGGSVRCMLAEVFLPAR
jgi:hypothetical protein